MNEMHGHGGTTVYHAYIMLSCKQNQLFMQQTRQRCIIPLNLSSHLIRVSWQRVATSYPPECQHGC